MFANSNEESIYRKVYENHMSGDKSFMGIEEGIKQMLEDDKYAHFEGYQYFVAYPQYACKVNNQTYQYDVTLKLLNLPD